MNGDKLANRQAASEAGASAFDRLAALACSIFDTPAAMMSLFQGDETQFWCSEPLKVMTVDRAASVSQAIAALGEDGVVVVEDAPKDAAFSRHPLVAGPDAVRFYAGAAITGADGEVVGAFGVIDRKPRARPGEAALSQLKMLAAMAEGVLAEARTGQALADQLEGLSLAEAMAGVGHWRFDAVKHTVTWSDQVFRIHGLEPGSVDPTRHDFEAQYHPDDWKTGRGLVRQAVLSGEGYEVDLRLYRDGEERVTRTRTRCERDATGAVAAVFGVFQDITETVRNQERIADSEAQFRLLSETATDVISRYTPEGRFLYLSPSVVTVLGRKPEDMVGRLCTEFILADDVPGIMAKFRDYFAAGPGAEPPRYEYRGLRADGSTVWLEASPRAVWDEAGQVLELHDHVRDVSARKASEREQTELVETLRLAERLAGLGSWRLDCRTGKVRWSEEVYRIHGVTPETFDPNLEGALEFYHPEDRQAVRDWCGRAMTGEDPGEFKMRLKLPNGDERIVVSYCRPEQDVGGKPTAVFGVFQDVTDRVLAEDRLAASEARYRLMADRASDILVTYGTDGLIRYISPSVETATGLAPQALIGLPVTSLIHDQDLADVKQAFRALVRGDEHDGNRVRYRGRALGELRWFEARTTLIRDADGQVTEFHDVVRDISETKRLEDELRAARDVAEAAARVKSEFLANMSHELRTPLTSVIGFSGLLQESAELPETEKRYADRIATASEALLSVINDILDYSKLEAEAVSLDAAPFDPEGMARGAAAMIERQCLDNGVDLSVRIADDVPAGVMGDEGRMRQVLLNFLSNAVKFTAAGEIRLDVARTGDRLRVAVSDSGIGIAPEKVDALFERFTQADASTTRVYGGTGLGLAISRRLIELMGGAIGAVSRPGEGSTFWFEVPLIEARETVQAQADEAVVLAPGLRILLADDAPANRELVRIIVSGWGVELDTVCDGAEAVRAAASGDYDLILMDVHMPVMDGLDASRAIRALDGPGGTVPILALTANVQPDQIEACAAAGMDGHVGKPIQIGELLGAIAGAFRSKTEADVVSAA